MPRFFVGTDQISDKDIVITGTDVNHIRNVLRMTPGEEVTVSDGQGMDYFCRIAELTKEEVRLDIVDSWHSFVELPAKIYLFQGLPKADKMELIIQKAVELGVFSVVPVETRRCVVKLDEKKAAKTTARWQQIAESAAKQSKRMLIPEVKNVMSWREALALAKELEALTKELGIKRLSEQGIKKEDFDMLADDVLKEPVLNFNPRQGITKEDVLAILEKAY